MENGDGSTSAYVEMVEAHGHGRPEDAGWDAAASVRQHERQPMLFGEASDGAEAETVDVGNTRPCTDHAYASA